MWPRRHEYRWPESRLEVRLGFPGVCRLSSKNFKDPPQKMNEVIWI